LVGEFFEVRAQVDRDLTTVSRVDQRLGLIKNLGRHTTEDFFVRCAFQDSTGYPWILGIFDLRPLRGRHAYKAFLRSALPDSVQLC
jgi:hypothetical protein